MSHFVNLHIVVPEAFILGSGEHHVDTGSAISLICMIEKVREGGFKRDDYYSCCSYYEILFNLKKKFFFFIHFPESCTPAIRILVS